MKFLITFASLALFAVINANPYGYGHKGYGGNVGYVQDYSYGQGYGNYGDYSYSQPLSAYNSHPSAAAAAASASAGLRPGNYKQKAVVGYELDAGYHGASPSYGYGHRY